MFGRELCNATVVPTSVNVLVDRLVLDDPEARPDLRADRLAQLPLFFSSPDLSIAACLARFRPFSIAPNCPNAAAARQRQNDGRTQRCL